MLALPVEQSRRPVVEARKRTAAAPAAAAAPKRPRRDGSSYPLKRRRLPGQRKSHAEQKSTDEKKYDDEREKVAKQLLRLFRGNAALDKEEVEARNS